MADTLLPDAIRTILADWLPLSTPDIVDLLKITGGYAPQTEVYRALLGMERDGLIERCPERMETRGRATIVWRLTRVDLAEEVARG